MNRAQQELQEKNQIYESKIQSHVTNLQKQQERLEQYEQEKNQIEEARRNKEQEIIKLNSKSIIIRNA